MLLWLSLLALFAACGPGGRTDEPTLAGYTPDERLIVLLRGGEGAVLHLPVEVGEPGQGAPKGSNQLWSQLAQETERQSLLSGEPLLESQAFADPLVPVAVDAWEGRELFAIPAGRPGQVLFRLGVSQVVVHRGLFSASSLAVLDPVLKSTLAPPQRDLVAGLDIYPVRPTAGLTPVAVGLVPVEAGGGVSRPGWNTLEDAMAGWRQAPGGAR